jgi:hypothetical protein
MKKPFVASFGLALIAVATACGGSRSPSAARTTMPSPDGCYVRVWDRSAFAGTTDFINGPRRYNHLRDLPGGRSWSKRIKSVQLGPSAVALAYSEEEFRGRNALLMPDADSGRFPVVAVSIQSLEVRCSLPTAARSILTEAAP